MSRPLPLVHGLLRGGFWAIGGRVIAALSGLAVNILLTRALPPEQVGAYFLAVSVVSLAVAFAVLGMDRAVVRLVAEGMALSREAGVRHTIARILRLTGVCTALTAAVYLLMRRPLLMGVFGSSVLMSSSVILAVWICAASFQYILSEVFRGFNDIRLATVFGGVGGRGRGLLWTVMLPAGIACLWVFGTASLAAVLTLATLISACAVGAAVMVLVSKMRRGRSSRDAEDGEGPDGIGTIDILRISFPLFVVGVVDPIRLHAGIWLLGAYRSQGEVALYGAALRLVMVIGLGLQIVRAIVPAVIAGMHAQGKTRQLEEVIRSVTTAASMLAFIVAALFVALGKPLLGALYGDYYEQAALPLAILSIGMAASVWAGPCALALMMTGNQKTAMAINVGSTVALLAAGLWAAQQYGMHGVAVVYAAELILRTGLTFLFARKRTGIWTHLTLSPKLVRRTLREIWPVGTRSES